MIGKLLGNRYQIISQLGGGGMALVYKGKDTLLNRQVTIKMLRPEYTSDDEFVSRFRNEAQAVAKLSHPNIVSVYDVGQEGNTHYIVMEYVEGRNLKEIIKNEKLTVTQAADIARQICLGLQDAHNNGIIHRDIKPHNILVTDSGRVKVTDFGIAQIMSSITVTNNGKIVGSVHYFSPEQAKGGATVAKSDIYSVGVVLYEMVTGRVPFDGETPIAIAMKHIESQPEPPSRLNPLVSRELEKIILKAMEKDQNKRYNSAGEMAWDLKKIVSEEPTMDIGDIESDEFATRVMDGPVVITKNRDKEPKEPVYKRRKKKKVRPAALVVFIVVMLGLLAGVGAALNNYLNVPEVTVPSVEGRSGEEAARILGEKNLHVKWEQRHDKEVEAGYVISQDPHPEEKVKEGSTVLLVLSKGPVFEKVPDVVRKEADDARVELENNGFKVRAVEEYNDNILAGVVISQTPDGNTEAKEGSTVKIVVSKGPEPRPATVPDLVSLSLEEARAKLEEAELELSTDIVQEESFDYVSGTVIKQTPAAGTQVQKGQEVKIVLSKGPGPEEKTAEVEVEIPNDGVKHLVKIVVSDVISTRTEYQGEHNPGDFITRMVTFYNKGVIKVFIDDMNKPFTEEPVE